MDQSTACIFCGNLAVRNGTVGSLPKYCSKSCEYRARYQRNRVKQLAARPIRSCLRCGISMPTARPDRKYCGSACQSQANRRASGKVVDNTGICASCHRPLIGRQSNATVCANRKCMQWAVRHPGVPHPSTQPRACAWCGVSIDHRNGKSTYCSKLCVTTAWVDENRDLLNERNRDAWADLSSGRKAAYQAYRKANAEQYRAYGRKYRAEDPERHRGYYAKWLSDPVNYQIVLLNGHKRREREQNNSGSVGVSIRDWMRLVRRYRSCCAYCGKFVERPIVEHVIPLARNGRHAIGNVLPSCAECNASKHASFIMEWRKRRTW